MVYYTLEPNRGLRHPLSPYLFHIAMKFFFHRTEDVVSQGKLRPTSKIKPIASNWLYTDDVVIFLEATLDNAIKIRHVFEDLKQSTGLQINQPKSKVYFGKSVVNGLEILQVLGMNKEHLLVKYLRVLLSSEYVNAA